MKSYRVTVVMNVFAEDEEQAIDEAIEQFKRTQATDEIFEVVTLLSARKPAYRV